MEYRMLVPKSGVGATWYCIRSETYKQFAVAYGLEGFEYRAKMSDYYVVDASHVKGVAEALYGKYGKENR